MLWLLASGYVIFIGWTLAAGYRAVERGDMPLYTDFTPTYAASMLVRAIPAENLYRPRPMAEAGRRAAHAMYDNLSDEQARGVGFAPWMYPPTFILLVAPLAYLPYLAAWVLWLGVTALPYVVAILQILPARLAWPFALAAPPVFYNLMYGQTGFLTGGLIGLGLALLGPRPMLAGILIGLASVKPHFGVLIPLALIAGAHWRAFWSAVATVLATIVVSIALLGMDPWYGFIGTFLFSLEGFGAGAFAWQAMTSVLSSAHMAGLALDAAWRVQYVASAAMALVVVWAWWRGRARPDTLGLQAAILCLATPLALPLAFLYDLVMIVPAIAWLWDDLRRRGAPREHYWVLAGSCAALLGVKTLAETASFQAGPWILGILLTLAVHRLRQWLLDDRGSLL